MNALESPPTPNLKPGLQLIVAMSRNRCIGKDGKLPWHIPEDLKHFRVVTRGHAIVMGRKTYDSIGRPLPDRRNIVVSRQPSLVIDGCEVYPSLQVAIDAAFRTDPSPVIIGGAALYAESLPYVQRMWVTEVPMVVEGDTFFPEWDPEEWMEAARRKGNEVEFVRYERV